MYNRALEMMVTLTALPTEKCESALVDEDEGETRVLLVTSSGRLHAIAVANVREVVRARSITRVPGTPPTMLGLVNVRGRVVTVLDLAECVRTPERTLTHSAGGVTEVRGESSASIVLLEHGSRVVGLSVDGVRDVRVLDDAAHSARVLTALASEGFPNAVERFGTAGGEVVVLLDVAALLARHLISSSET